MAGVSPQSVYKRIRKVDNPIQPYLVEKKGQVMLKFEALKELYGVEVEQPGLNIEQPIEEVKQIEGKEAI